MHKLFFILLFISTPAFAWSNGDTKREAVYLALHAADWLQTREVAHNPDIWREQNVILGKQPSLGRVNNYFAATALAHIGVACVLPYKWRAPFQYLTIGMEAGVVAHNYLVGVRASF